MDRRSHFSFTVRVKFSLSTAIKTNLTQKLAGKDRTGVLAALILHLGGSSQEAIVHDYVLTRIGIEQRRQSLALLLKFRVDEQAPPESLGMLELCNIHANAMAGFLKAIEEFYEEGIQGYVKGRLGFGQRDVDIIRANLRRPVS